MFIGRRTELSELNKLYQKSTFQMAVIYGRRRIGKTRLIQEFIKDKTAIFMTAVEAGITANLELLSSAIYLTFLGEDDISMMPPFKDFRTALQYITKKSKQSKVLLIIDEYPYLAQADKSISSVIQALIDQEWKSSNLMLILCGSSMSFMENQVLGYQSPLYGRRTGQFHLKPLDYYESSLFVPHYSAEEKALVYGITGGIPQYLEMINDSLSIKENVLEMYLNPNAYLYEEPSNLMKQELKEPSNYNAIVEAIAKGSTKLNEISAKVQMENSNVSACLKSLIALGLVEKESAVTEEDNKKKTSYILADQMFRFWYRYVPQCMLLINTRKPERAYDKLIAPDLQNYMGKVFEKICLQHLSILNAEEKLPFDILKLGRWWGNNPVLKRQEEVDLLGVNDIDKAALFGECKFRNEATDLSTVELLIQRSELFPKYQRKGYICYSKTGYSDAVIDFCASQTNFMKLFTLEELYEIDMKY